MYRQVNQVYADDYTKLMESGLYSQLVDTGLLIPHVETGLAPAESATAYKIIQPERVPFISYPYEWSFGQLKDAALTTLSIQKRALKSGLILKDASAYNIQFVRGRPILIDTLSFTTYEGGRPWDAYRQFCQHFLAPLALMSYRDVRLGQLLRIYIDGVPLDLASELLPGNTRLNFGLLTHIHIHANAQRRFSSGPVNTRGARMSPQAMLGLIENLEITVKKLTWKPATTEWGNYYAETNYSDAAFEHKKKLVRAWTAEKKPGLLWDLGANTGVFSRECAASAGQVISFDIDPAAVEQNYRTVRKNGERNILPLLLDLTNPSPALGWDHRERDSFAARGPVDMVLALAVIHHLAISNNLSLQKLADFFAARANCLVLEFVPKSDSQVKRLLASRKDIFPDYTREAFESVFSTHFKFIKAESLQDSERMLYLLEAR